MGAGKGLTHRSHVRRRIHATDAHHRRGVARREVDGARRGLAVRGRSRTRRLRTTAHVPCRQARFEHLGARFARNRHVQGRRAIAQSDGQGRGVRVPVPIGQGVGEHITHPTRGPRVAGVAVAAVRQQGQGPIGAVHHHAHAGSVGDRHAGSTGRNPGHRRIVRTQGVGTAITLGIGDHVANRRTKVPHAQTVGVVHRCGYVIDDPHRQGVGRGVAVTVGEYYCQIVEQVIRPITRRVGLVIAQGVFVGDRASARIKAGYHQGVAQWRGHRGVGRPTGVEHNHTAYRQAAKAVRDADVKGPGLGQRRHIGVAAIGQIGFVDAGITTLAGRRQPRDVHRVIRRWRRRGRWWRRRRRFALNLYGQSRSVSITVGVGQGVGEDFGLATDQAAVGGIDIATVGVQHQGAELAVDDGTHAGAVGDGHPQVLAGDDAGDGRAGAVGAGHVGFNPVDRIVVGAGEDITAGAAAGTDFIDIRNRIRNVIDDAHRELVFDGVAVAVGENNRQAVEQVVDALPGGVRFVVVQRVFVGHLAGRRIVAGDDQGVAQRGCYGSTGEPGSIQHFHAADGEAAQPVRCAEGEAACLGQGRRIGRAAIRQVRLVDTDVTACGGRGQTTDRHAVIRRGLDGFGNEKGVRGWRNERRGRDIRIKARGGIARVESPFEADTFGNGIAAAAALSRGWSFELLAEVFAGGDGALQLGEFRILVGVGVHRGNSAIGARCACGLALRRDRSCRAGFRWGVGRLRAAAGRSRSFHRLGSVGALCGGCRLCCRCGLVGFPLRDLRLDDFSLLDFVVHRLSPVVACNPVCRVAPRSSLTNCLSKK